MQSSGNGLSEASRVRRALFVNRLPKIKLHAHLNGSIRRSTLRELATAKGVDPSNAFILTKYPNTLNEAFDVFRVIHSCVATLQDVERLSFELGQDLEEDGVVYAEIRTTPRSMTYSSGDETWDHGLVPYVEAVLRGFSRNSDDPGKQSSASRSNKVVLRLLLSIDRAKHSAQQARSIVELAHGYHHQGVVRIDLSGDPTKGEWSDFEPALQHARSLGLKVTLHAGEVRDRNEEMGRMLDFHPDSFGHCCFVSPVHLDRLKDSAIPIELCLTSNLLSNSVSELQYHHFGLHYSYADSSNTHVRAEGDLTICCISTDDSGVFGSDLSNEYRLVMETFGLSEQHTFHLAWRTLGAIFLTRTWSDSFSSTGEEEMKMRRKDQGDLDTIQSAFQHFYSPWEWK